MTDAWPVPELARDVVDTSPNVIYLLDADLRIRYCNPAWDHFALNNDGEAALAAKILHMPLFDAIPAVMQPFYREVFAACAEDGEPFAFDYECSSPSQFRRFRMEVMPSKAGRGFGIINALRVERPHGTTAVLPSEEHLGANGIIVMCAHCRKTRSAKEPARWDWVPAYVASKTAPISHGLCPPCGSYHYDAVLKSSRRHTAR